MACSAMTLAMPDKLILAVNIVGKAKTDWPEEKACLILKYLTISLGMPAL